jgi:hypothetical protein
MTRYRSWPTLRTRSGLALNLEDITLADLEAQASTLELATLHAGTHGVRNQPRVAGDVAAGEGTRSPVGEVRRAGLSWRLSADRSDKFPSSTG